MLPAFALFACAPSPDPGLGGLVRASMSVRGVRPTLDEIAAVREDPARLEALVAGWLDDPRFGETVRDMHAEQFLVRTDTQDHLDPVGALAPFSPAEIVASIDEEPLMLIERVVVEGRPYTEIVTGATAMANAVTARAHGLAYDEAGPDWQETTWLDGRPAAGVLSSTTLWQRHLSSNVNLHRTRASFVLSKLLCEPLPSGAVSSVPGAAEGDALADDPVCAGCHQKLDPLASAFYGLADYVLPVDTARAEARGCPPEGAFACLPLPFWDPERVAAREADGMPAPALLGVPVADIGELGRAIAAHPAFASCTARRFASWFGQIPAQDVPDAVVDELTATLVDADWDARAVVLAVALDPAFHDPEGWAGRLRVRPEQLSRTVEDLTGFRWVRDVPEHGEVDLLTTDATGHRMLAGGVNGWDSIVPVHAPTASRELVLARVAEAAASHAVDSGRWPPLPRSEGRSGPGGLVTGRAEVREALQTLSLRITGVPDRDTGGLEALFEGALARSGDPRHAWKVTITALLLDPAAEQY